MNSKKIICLLAGIIFCIFQLSLQAQNLENRVDEYTLDNGMKFLLMERHETPIFSGAIVFKVGGVDEPRGETGLAHMFEHMAFKGTPVIGTKDYKSELPILDEIERVGEELSLELKKQDKMDSARVGQLRKHLAEIQARQQQYIVNNEFMHLYESAGGTSMNAGTGNDITMYYVSLPSNKLELWMLMESERIKYPVFREFYKERDVILEERRMRTETQPMGKLEEQMMAIAFVAHPYRNPVVGWMSDISTVTVAGAKDFHKKYYVPGNAVGALVGDFKISEIKKLLDQYFGDIPKAPQPSPVATVEPLPSGERRIQVEFDAEPQALIGYPKPTIPNYDDYVFDVIDAVLSNGRTSRFYTALVKQKQMVLGISTYQGLPGARYPNLFVIHAVPRQPFGTDTVEKAIYEELERLKTEPVTPHELEKVRNQIDANFIRQLASNDQLAFMLGYLQVIAGDWRYLLKQREMFKKVSAEDIMNAAKKYFVPRNRIVATIVSKE